MIRHLCKVIWVRRRSNVLVMGEVLASFLVLFGVATLGAHQLDRFRRPLGYRPDDVWRVHVQGGRAGAAARRQSAALLSALQRLPGVVAVAAIRTVPYQAGRRSHSSRGGLRFGVNWSTDRLPQVLRMPVVRGRWFGGGDEGSGNDPIVVNEAFARAVFGTVDPVGRSLADEGEEGSGEPLRVVGVIADFRVEGELGAAEPYLFKRWRLQDGAADPPEYVLLRVMPGSRAGFERRLIEGLRAIDGSFTVESLSRLRDKALRETLAPVTVIALVALFLMAMVTLGLSGVVWQSVTDRRREVGLRRAHGATAADIRRQFLGELVLMASVAIGGGVLIVLHLPVPAEVEAGSYLAGFAVSAMTVYGLVLACGYYPARLASRLTPADALRYE
jgi:putative ABC transport system permease protein